MHIAYLLDPRFPGGTSSAIAQELAVTTRIARVTLHEIRSGIFAGDQIAPVLEEAMLRHGLTLERGKVHVSADVVVLHNLSLLKIPPHAMPRIFCRHLVAVTHENFLRQGEDIAQIREGFDVAAALSRLDKATVAFRRSLAPISTVNRRTVEDWASSQDLPVGWTVTGEDWQNICAFPIAPATDRPRDRRGRHSRPGPEKFPGLAALDLCFTEKAEVNLLLGADTLANAARSRPHWQVLSFGAMPVAEFLSQIDFLVYFTAQTWRESFCRAIAEALAAGKVVITDAGTASTFGDGAIAATPDQVDAIIQRLIADPAAYRRQVAKGQLALKGFSEDAFLRKVSAILDDSRHERCGAVA